MSLSGSISTITNPLVEVIVYAYQIWKSLTPEVLVDLVVHAPRYYNLWWTRLLNEAPLHILIETFLICFIIWLVVWNRTEDPKKSKKSILSEKEKNELIKSWTPEPLVPKLTPRQQALTGSRVVRRRPVSSCICLLGVAFVSPLAHPTPPPPHHNNNNRPSRKSATTATSSSAACPSPF